MTMVRNSDWGMRSRSLLSDVSGWECRDVDGGGVVSEHVPLLAHVLLPDLLLEDRLEGELVLDLLHLPAQPLDVVVLQEDDPAPQADRAHHPDLGAGLDHVGQLPRRPVLHGLDRLFTIS